MDELLAKLKALGLFVAENAPYTGQAISGARTLDSIRNRDAIGTGLGILGLLPMGGTIRKVANKSGTIRNIGRSWFEGMTQREAQQAARVRGFRIKKNEYGEFVVTGPKDHNMEYFTDDLKDAVMTMDYEANLIGR
jgi:hypothetical protein